MQSEEGLEKIAKSAKLYKAPPAFVICDEKDAAEYIFFESFD